MDLLFGVALVGAAAWLALQLRRGALTTTAGGLTNGSSAPAPTTPAYQVGPIPQEAQGQAPFVAWQTPAAGLAYQGSFDVATVIYRLPVGLLARMAWQESRFKPDAVSPAGALGLMQFLPATAADFNLDPFDPQASIDAAGRYMRQLYDRFGDWRTALAAYNWGQGNVAAMGLLDPYPPETVAYVNNIAGAIGL